MVRLTPQARDGCRLAPTSIRLFSHGICYLRLYRAIRFDQAVAEGERAVAINPNFASGYQVLSDALTQSNRPEEAVRAERDSR